LSGALLAALPTDVDRQKIMDYTYETFLGWRRMCELSKDFGIFSECRAVCVVIGGSRCLFNTPFELGALQKNC